MRSRLLFLAVAFSAAVLLSSCASVPRAEQLSVPRAIELRDEPQISTFHFPSGIYSLADSDPTGFYYAAPSHVMKHGFPGSIPYQGGIFMQREDHRRLRGYVIWAGGRTPIGNLSRASYRPVD